ncbi:C163A protein, partial [Bucorvus abyssinicus]|nr:C163A protein [Bucorvus abyssinicus]
DAVELRLAAGGGPCAGRVEVKLRGRWGTVIENNWGMEEAEVVCQQLGCGSAAGAYPAASLFGQGGDPVSLALVNCHGYETTIWDCEIRGWGPYSGLHSYDTAVVCQGFARLVGGDSGCSGWLEVRRNRTWTRVCEDGVDIQAAQVVCRELGCGVALAVSSSGRLETGRGPFWEGGFECNGTEPLLSACARRPPRGQDCAGHAGIVCSPYTGFRLADHSSGCAGRVEVEAGGTWGSLCATGWDLPDAHVLCRHLGCGPAVAVPPGGSFGVGRGPLRRDAFGCSGSERHPGECPVAVLGQPACPPGHAAAVNCSGVYGTCRDKSLKGLWGCPTNCPVPSVAAGSRRVRLAGGPGRCAGRVEVYVNGTWSTVCQEPWDMADATVVCRQLGCGMALAAPGSTRFGPGTGPLWPDAGGCAG